MVVTVGKLIFPDYFHTYRDSDNPGSPLACILSARARCRARNESEWREWAGLTSARPQCKCWCFRPGAVGKVDN